MQHARRQFATSTTASPYYAQFLPFISNPLQQLVTDANSIAAIPLKQRSLICLQGTQVKSFLQGLTTNNVLQLNNATLQANLFLNSKGRVLFDTQLFESNDNSLYVECDTQYAQQLVQMLNRYKLRLKIAIEQVQHLQVYAVLGNQSKALEMIEQWKPAFYALDARLPTCMGYRCYATAAAPMNMFADESIYTMWRMMHGIAEGQTEIAYEDALPLEFNFDYLNAINWNKGCYVGQELTARTKYVGQVRKRVLPILMQNQVLPIGTTLQSTQPQQDAVVGRPQRATGQIIATCSHLGLAMLRLDDAFTELRSTDNQVQVSAIKPFWL